MFFDAGDVNGAKIEANVVRRLMNGEVSDDGDVKVAGFFIISYIFYQSDNKIFCRAPLYRKPMS